MNTRIRFAALALLVVSVASSGGTNQKSQAAAKPATPSDPTSQPATLAAAKAVPLGQPRPVVTPPTTRPCPPERIPASAVFKPAAVLLNIPDRPQHPDRPPDGWCGECAVQQALLYYGAFFPQAVINKAGQPKRGGGMYADELPTALASLGIAFDSWPEIRELPVLLDWLRFHIRRQVPVLVGIKINPTQHPEWCLDHFVIAPGFNETSFIFNTTTGRRETRSTTQLASDEDGYSFKNRFNAYYALALLGPTAVGPGLPVVRLMVVKETRDAMEVIVKCEGLTPQKDYVVYKAPAYGNDPKPVAGAAFRAAGDVYAFCDTLPAASAAVYRCQLRDTPPPKPAEPAATVHARLLARLPEVRFEKMPLEKAVDFLAQVGHVKIDADWDVLARSGLPLNKDVPVSLSMSSPTLRAALWKTLLGVDVGGTGRLGYVIRDDEVVVCLAGESPPPAGPTTRPH